MIINEYALPSKNVIDVGLSILPTSKWFVSTTSPAAKSTLFYVQEAGEFHCLPQYFTKRKGLASFLIIYTLGGNGKLEYCGKKYSLSSNQALWINCMNHQYYCSDKDSKWDILWLHFYGTPALQYYNLFMNLSNDSVVNLPQNDPFPALFREILTYDGRANGIDVEIKLSELIVKIMTRLLLTAQSSKTSLNNRPSYVDQAIEIINHDYSKKLTLEYFAQHFNMNKQYFQKIFKRHIGLTPNEFLIMTRINVAKEILRSQTTSIADIAKLVGFDNTSFFIETFKRHEGITPLDFRKNWREK